MIYDRAFLENFIEQFGSAHPPPSARSQTVSKQLLVASVRPQIEQWRREGHSLNAIAERFTVLGVTMSVATLRTCLRRSRNLAPKSSRGSRSRQPRTPTRQPEATKSNGVESAGVLAGEPSPSTAATDAGTALAEPRARSSAPIGVAPAGPVCSATPTSQSSTEEPSKRDTPPLIAAATPAGPNDSTLPTGTETAAKSREKRVYRSAIVIPSEKPLSSLMKEQ